MINMIMHYSVYTSTPRRVSRRDNLSEQIMELLCTHGNSFLPRQLRQIQFLCLLLRIQN